MPVKKASKRKTKLSIETQKTSVSSVVDKYILKDKLKQPKIIIGLIVVALAVAAFFLRGLFIVAIVNGEPISRISIIRELEKQSGKQALSALVNQALILQEARKKNIQVSQAEIDAAVKQIENSLKSQGQDLGAALAAQGMTKEDLFTQLRLRNIVEKLLADKIKVTDKEIADYMEKNKESIPANLTSAEVKKSVGEQLKQQKLGTASQALLGELTKNAKVNYFVNY